MVSLGAQYRRPFNPRRYQQMNIPKFLSPAACQKEVSSITRQQGGMRI